MQEAVDLAKRGSFVDIDTVDEDLPKQLRLYFDKGGLPDKLTVSTDSAIKSPQNMIDQIRRCVLEHKFPLEKVLPLVTANTATVLKLNDKGVLEARKSADILILRKDALEIKDVIAGGRRMVKSGKVCFKENFLKDNNRRVVLEGEKAK